MLAWRHRSLGAAGCALLFAHLVVGEGWLVVTLPVVGILVVAAVVAVLFTGPVVLS